MITIAPLRDHRLHWMKDMERSSSGVETYFETYEFFSDCRIPGITKYGDGYLLCASMYEVYSKESTNSYQMLLRRPTGIPEVLEAGKKGSRFMPVDELLSLLSLFMHARFYLRHTTVDALTEHGIASRIHSNPVHRPIKFDEYTPPLFADGGRNFVDFVGFLDEISAIEPRFYRDLMYSIFFYASGIRWIGVDDTIAYIKLCISIEILAKDKTAINDELNDKLSEVKGMLLDPSLKNEVSGFQKQRKIWRSFIAFIMKYKGTFLQDRKTPGVPTVTEANLGTFLEAIYQNRSEYIHAGTPMAISELNHVGWDALPWVEQSIQGTLVTEEKKKMPTSVFFEELVRHCLLAYLRSLPKIQKV